LRLVRRYLRAGVEVDGVVMARDEGVPQGAPLSPLLANVLLDEVDRALEQRDHRFARYADDCNVYVRSQKAGERVLRWMRKLYARLHLRVNEKARGEAACWSRSSRVRTWPRHGNASRPTREVLVSMDCRSNRRRSTSRPTGRASARSFSTGRTGPRPCVVWRYPSRRAARGNWVFLASSTG
jgi:hypothetical protein